VSTEHEFFRQGKVVLLEQKGWRDWKGTISLKWEGRRKREVYFDPFRPLIKRNECRYSDTGLEVCSLGTQKKVLGWMGKKGDEIHGKKLGGPQS